MEGTKPGAVEAGKTPEKIDYNTSAGREAEITTNLDKFYAG